MSGGPTGWHPPDEAERAQADEASIMRTGVPVVELQEHLVRADGEEAWRVTTKQPLRDGEPTGAYGGRVLRGPLAAARR